MYRILIVEDDATMAKAMKTQIDSWGNQAETVKDFQNVISAFLNFDPHMVLMDIMLPFYNDFIPKPVDLTVMMAKIQAVLRRTYDMAGKIPVLEHKGAVLNLNDTTLFYDGEKIELTKNEFRILKTLLEQKGKVVSRDTLMTRLWQMDDYVEENTLTVNVTRLRKKLEQAGLCDFIKTKIGSGYIIE